MDHTDEPQEVLPLAHRPHLHQLGIGHGQETCHTGELTEELVGELPKASALGPLQEKPQGGSDPNPFGPVEAAQGGACGGQETALRIIRIPPFLCTLSWTHPEAAAI